MDRFVFCVAVVAIAYIVHSSTFAFFVEIILNESEIRYVFQCVLRILRDEKYGYVLPNDIVVPGLNNSISYEKYLHCILNKLEYFEKYIEYVLFSIMK